MGRVKKTRSPHSSGGNTSSSAILSAEYWMYDTRLGRRWNLDPVGHADFSPYLTFANNPIYYSDPLGLDSTNTIAPVPGGAGTAPDKKEVGPPAPDKKTASTETQNSKSSGGEANVKTATQVNQNKVRELTPQEQSIRTAEMIRWGVSSVVSTATFLGVLYMAAHAEAGSVGAATPVVGPIIVASYIKAAESISNLAYMWFNPNVTTGISLTPVGATADAIKKEFPRSKFARSLPEVVKYTTFATDFRSLFKISEIEKLKTLKDATFYAGKFMGTGIKISTFIHQKTDNKKEQKK